MGLLSLLTLPVTAPLRGVLWVAEQIAEQVEGEYYNEDRVRSALIDLEMSLDMGAIDEEEYEAAETILLERLKEIRARKAAAAE
ncbi:MAG: hypothetical protein HC893_15425 [Chloroflexaceae bacterium]|nr:hypothetical protein [Chloroflexaceae bacterium]NJL34977.1 hypothetical protein [Chloroflexaceae bacterium]NJO05590.1 hypothetical protein [Chloroflexaceae bacterium]